MSRASHEPAGLGNRGIAGTYRLSGINGATFEHGAAYRSITTVARLSRPFLSLLTLAVVLGPVAPRAYIACADGSPCPPPVHRCCPPSPCAAHAAANPTPDRQCVVLTRTVPETIAAGAAVAAPVPSDPTPFASAVPSVLPPPRVAIAAAVADRNDHPPDQPAPKQGRAPRAPPFDTL